ncbi:MAG: TlpA disulfide reductase family protein [Bacteroidota bacterium]
MHFTKPQTPFTFTTNKKPIIRGRLNGYDPQLDANLVLLAILVVPTVSLQTQKEIRIQKDGQFFIELEDNITPQQIWLKVGEYYFGQLLLFEKIIVDIDLNALRGGSTQYYINQNVTFSGPDAELCDYVNRYTTYLSAHHDQLDVNITKIYIDKSIPLNEKLQMVKDRKAASQKLLEGFTNDNPSKNKEVLFNDLLSDYYGRIMIVYSKAKQAMPAALLEKVLAHEPHQLSNDGVNYYRYLCFYLRNADPSNDQVIFQQKVLPEIEDLEEKQRLQNYLALHMRKTTLEGDNKALYKQEHAYFTSTYQSILAAEKTIKFCQQVVSLGLGAERTDLLLACGGSEDIWRQEAYLQIVLPKIRTPWVQEYLKRERKVAKATMTNINETIKQAKTSEALTTLGISHGKLDNGTTFYVPNYTEVKDLLAALRTHFPGKAFILDIWAAWCGPCLSDMKQEKSTINKAQLKEMGVEVIYLCSNEHTDIDTWKRKVTELDMGPSIHLFMNDALGARLMTIFKLRGFPSHIFLDQQGNYKPDIVHRISNIDVEKIKNNL